MLQRHSFMAAVKPLKFVRPLDDLAAPERHGDRSAASSQGSQDHQPIQRFPGTFVFSSVSNSCTCFGILFGRVDRLQAYDFKSHRVPNISEYCIAAMIRQDDV